MAEGKIIIETDIGVKESEKRLKELERVAKSSANTISDEMSTSAKKVTNEWNIAKSNYDRAMKEMIFATESLEDSIGALNVSKELGDTEGIINARQEIDALEPRIATLAHQVDRYGIAMEGAGNKAHNIAGNITGAVSETGKLDRRMAKVDSTTKKVSKSAGSISSGISKGIKSLGKYALALFGIRAVYSTLRKLSQQWLDSDDAGAQQIKANLSAISNALSNALAPIITYIANLFVTIVAYANALLKAFFGIDLLSKKTSKNTNKIGSGAKKVTKELKKWTGSFDKADIASSNISDNMDNAGGGGAMDMAVEAKIPTPDISNLLKAFETAKGIFESIWNNPNIQSIMGSLSTLAIVSFQSIASIAGNVWDNFLLSFDEILPHLQRGFEAQLAFWELFLSDMADFTEKWLPVVTEKFNTLVDNVFETFRPLTTFIGQLWADFWEIILELWTIHGAPLLDKFGQWVANAVEIWDKIWAIIDTIITPIIDILVYVWDSTLKDMLFELGDFILELIGYALDFYNKFVAPIMKFLLDVLQPLFAIVFGTIGGIVAGVFNGIISTITVVIQTIRGVLSGLIKFITGVFKGDWSSAWQGIVDIFGSIFKGIGNLMKIPVNFIIDGLNGFIRGLNKIKIPDWVPGVGGKGINIGQIPRLAKGGVLREETLNIAGEYAGARTNPEIVTPQNTMRETFEDVLSRMGNLGKGGNETINLVVNGEKLASVLRNEDEKENFMMNGGMNFATI